MKLFVLLKERIYVFPMNLKIDIDYLRKTPRLIGLRNGDAECFL
jgi:hypothetical protein